ncbi:MAG: hypothetical protein RLZZ519_1843, partial [Bacteroidota bacterium]
MLNNIIITIKQEGRFRPARHTLNCENIPMAPLLAFFSWANRGKIIHLLPRILEGKGGNGIADYCSYHFTTEPEIGAYVRPGYVLLSEYAESVEIPLLLFYHLLAAFLEDSEGKQLGKEILECASKFQHQGTVDTRYGDRGTLIQYRAEDDWKIPTSKRHLLEELNIAACALLGAEKMPPSLGISLHPRDRFINAMKSHSFWGQPIPKHIKITYKGKKFAYLKDLSLSYEFLLALAANRSSAIDLKYALDLLPLSIDFHART